MTRKVEGRASAAATAEAEGPEAPGAGTAVAVADPAAASIGAVASLSGAAAAIAGDLNPASAGNAAAIRLEINGEGPGADTTPAPAETAPRERRRLPACLSDSGLSARISACNRFPARGLHPSWLPEGWDPAWLAAHGNIPRAEARLGEAVMRHWKLDARPAFDFDRPARRLALLDREPLERMVLLAGLARHADGIARVLERDKVKELRRQIGEEAYRFALFRAPLMAGHLGAAPAPALTGAGWNARALASGLRMLGDCLAGAPAGLIDRVALKLPRHAAALIADGDTDASSETCFRLFRRILLQEVDPAWDRLFS